MRWLLHTRILCTFSIFQLHVPCSLFSGENEANVRWLLDTYPDMQLVQQSPRLGQPGLTGRACTF